MKAVVIALGCLLANFSLASAGPCFPVHGRLDAYNGNPTFRIWIIGSTTILGVRDNPEHSRLPRVVKRAFGRDAFTRSIYADFKVCALTARRAGAMQMVRIVSAAHLRVVRVNPYAR